jgi:hypothetical protein
MGTPMSLFRVDENKIDSVEMDADHGLYLKYKKEVPKEIQMEIGFYIANVLNHVKSERKRGFCLRSHFPSPWPPALVKIYEYCPDEKFAAFILAYEIMQHLINDSDKWNCFKTNMSDRDFENNYYWLD